MPISVNVIFSPCFKDGFLFCAIKVKLQTSTTGITHLNPATEYLRYILTERLIITGIRNTRMVDNSRGSNHFRPEITRMDKRIVNTTWRKSDRWTGRETAEIIFAFDSLRIRMKRPDRIAPMISH
jgi:hypothetical protein